MPCPNCNQKKIWQDGKLRYPCGAETCEYDKLQRELKRAKIKLDLYQ